MSGLESQALIECPLTGEVVEPTDVDGMAEIYHRLDGQIRALQSVTYRIRGALGALAQSGGLTRRVRGERHRVMLTMPSPSWDQGVLKEVWRAHPVLAPQYLRVAKIDPIAKELKKLRAESGPAEFGAFRDLILSAEGPPTGLPRVKLETSTEDELEEQGRRLQIDLEASLGEGE